MRRQSAASDLPPVEHTSRRRADAIGLLSRFWVPRTHVGATARDLLSGGDDASYEELQRVAQQWTVRYLSPAGKYSAGQVCEVDWDRATGTIRLVVYVGGPQPQGTPIFLKNVSKCCFAEEEVPAELVEHVLRSPDGGLPAPPRPPPPPPPAQHREADRPRLPSAASSRASLLGTTIGSEAGTLPALPRPPPEPDTGRLSSCSGSSTRRDSAPVLGGPVDPAGLSVRADSWPRVRTPTPAAPPAARGGIADLNRVEQEAKDLQGEWWPVRILGANPDGTLQCHVMDGTIAADGTVGKFWPVVHKGNMRPRREDSGRPEAATGRRPSRLQTAVRMQHVQSEDATTSREPRPRPRQQQLTDRRRPPSPRVRAHVEATRSVEHAAAGRAVRQDAEQRTVAEVQRQLLAENLLRLGLEEVQVPADGNCQFRSLAWHLWEGAHWRYAEVRNQVTRQLMQCRPLYEPFLAKSPDGDVGYPEFVERMQEDSTWGDHVTLQAASDHHSLLINVITSHECADDSGSPRGGWLHRVHPRDGDGQSVEAKRVVWVSFLEEAHAEHYNPILPAGSSGAPAACILATRARAAGA